MFEDSLLDLRLRGKRKAGATVLSFAIQIFLLCILVLVPLIYTDALPAQQFMTMLVAPPPPPPPPPPAAAAPVKVVKPQTEVVNGALRTPTKIPEKVQMLKEDDAPMMAGGGGVVGGVPGGVPGGSLGGVLGGIIGSASSSVPKIAQPTVQRIKVSQGVQEGLLTNKVQPSYPPLARQARIQGEVVLQAVISKSGTIENLKLISGHPMLAPAAIDAVKQWKYKPYYLNGEPVEVDTMITVKFNLSGGA